MSAADSSASESYRYSRQIRFAPIGEEGQRKIEATRVLVCGCGALGSMIAERLARSGVGKLRLVDRDWVELSNLQRQTLFTQQDASEARPKAVAAASAISEINAEIHVEAIVEDVSFQNINALAEDCDLILDGTDNFETRFLINDFCVKHNLPWIHGGCLGASGQILSILPGETACFRCLLPELPPREVLETCDSAGVLAPAVGIVACWQAAEALKVLSGNRAAVCRGLIVLDTWQADCRVVALNPQADCPACSRREFPFLNGEIRSDATVLCGKNAVQIDSPNKADANPVQTLEALGEKLRSLGKVQQTPYFVRLTLEEYQLTIFRGGRAVIEGTTSISEAKTLLSRTLGA